MLEIVPLPDIIPLDETPDYVAGVANMHGQIVAIIDLNLRFGHPPQRCRVEDLIVFLELGGSAVGVVVNEVENVVDIAVDEMAPLPSHGAERSSDSPFIKSLLKSGEQIVMLLHLENLLDVSQCVTARHGPREIMPLGLRSTVYPGATPQETALLRERARTLALPPERPDKAGLLSLAVVRLAEELFGIELRAIREFAELRTVTPVPCCPGHVVGQMNLRGGLIVLIDMAGPLGLPPTGQSAGSIVMVLEDAELVAGVLVDEVLDVCYLLAADVSPAPASARSPGQEYVRGTAPHGTRILSLLDLPALLRQNSLIVNEKP